MLMIDPKNDMQKVCIPLANKVIDKIITRLTISDFKSPKLTSDHCITHHINPVNPTPDNDSPINDPLSKVILFSQDLYLESGNNFVQKHIF